MTVIFFTAPYCAPCKEIYQTVVDTVKSSGHTLDTVDVSTTNGKQSAANFGVVVTPELIVLDDNGQKKSHLVGADKIKSELQNILGNSKTKGWFMLGGGILVSGLALYMLKRTKSVTKK